MSHSSIILKRSTMSPTTNTASNIASEPSTATSSSYPSPFLHHQPAHPSTPPLFALAHPGPSTMQRAPPTSATSSKATSSRGSPRLVPSGAASMSGANMVKMEDLVLEPDAKMYETIKEAVAAFEDALLDFADSSEEEDNDEDNGGIPSLNLNPASVVKISKSGGWAKGVAREMTGFQLVVDVPVWTPECFADLSTMHSLRDKTLRTLHLIIDDLSLRAGIRTTYRLLSTAQGGAWGCIRVAPFPMSRPKSRQPTSPLAISPVSGNSTSSGRKPVRPNGPSVRTNEALDTPKSSSTAGPPSGSSAFRAVRRSTFAVVDKGQVGGFAGIGGRTLEDPTDSRHKEEVSVRVRDAVARDVWGNIDEGRSYVLAIHCQPALVIT